MSIQQNEDQTRERIHASADEHVERHQGFSTMSSGGFSHWERHYEATEELKQDDGNVRLNSEVHRFQEDTSTDAYAIVSWGEMGGGYLSGVNPGVRNSELTLEHDWESNADMEFDSRYPTSNVTGTQTESWSASISLPFGVTATGGESYSQPNVQTYDESNPWNNLGKWRVDIDSTHTKRYTAQVNPGSTAQVDRDDCIDPPMYGPTQPVATVRVDAEFKDTMAPSYTPRYTKSLYSVLNDVPFEC